MYSINNAPQPLITTWTTIGIGQRAFVIAEKLAYLYFFRFLFFNNFFLKKIEL